MNYNWIPEQPRCQQPIFAYFKNYMYNLKNRKDYDMPINDFMSKETQLASRLDEKAAREEAARKTGLQTIISRTFERAARREKEIARAVARNEALRIDFSIARPINKPSDVLKTVFGAVVDFFRLPSPIDIEVGDIEANPAYQAFKDKLKQESLEITNLKAATVYGYKFREPTPLGKCAKITIQPAF